MDAQSVNLSPEALAHLNRMMQDDDDGKGHLSSTHHRREETSPIQKPTDDEKK